MLKQPLKKVLIKRGIITLSLFMAIYLVMLFANHPDAVEKYYSESSYLFICRILHPVFNIFPFSAGDIIYLLVIAYIIYALVRLIKLFVKKQFAQAGLFTMAIIIGIQCAVLMFYLLWGLNYFRPSAAKRLNLTDSTFTIAELQKVTNLLIDSANACRARVTLEDLEQSNDSVYYNARLAVIKLSNSSVQFKTYSPDIKPSLLTPLLNYIGTYGYYNPFTGEAQINYQMPVFNRPFVACHEMSHQMGYGAEDEANFAGFLAARNSGDRLLRYSAYNLALGEFMRTLRYTDSLKFKKLKNRISPLVKADFKTERTYWLSYQTKINAVTSLFYDNFLKANNQPAGLDTYNRMVLLLMAMYRHNYTL
ncbi:DUF3810 domain-containing protein [Mucilaginibacter litoreus]|uniref:DUF3810 domain-containing protein n=1 Tax=Mucilaginibacter litoreus TaxID=1048221 RepID=A0ABW3AR60_9SPHI